MFNMYIVSYCFRFTLMLFKSLIYKDWDELRRVSQSLHGPARVRVHSAHHPPQLIKLQESSSLFKEEIGR